MTTEYQSPCFSIIPVFGGTGQQLKVPEAMSHGLAVVGYRKRIDESILLSGSEGYLATSEDEFISSVIRLWSDRNLAATMGRNAQEKVRSSLSQNSLNIALGKLIKSLEGNT